MAGALTHPSEPKPRKVGDTGEPRGSVKSRKTVKPYDTKISRDAKSRVIP